MLVFSSLELHPASALVEFVDAVSGRGAQGGTLIVLMKGLAVF